MLPHPNLHDLDRARPIKIINIKQTDDDDGDLRAEAAREEVRPVAILIYI